MNISTKYSDLELVLNKRESSSYSAVFRFHSADDAAEQRSERAFSLDASGARGWSPGDYAKNLGDAFFNTELKGEFNRYRSLALAVSGEAVLKVRISIESSAQELHAIRWETLRDPAVEDPAEDALLFTGEKTIVSRFLASSYDSQPIRLRAQGDLSALIVVANPKGLDEFPQYDLAPVNVDEQLNAAKAAMSATAGSASITGDPLAPGGGVPLTAIIDQLRKGRGYDILYLVCHGALTKDGPLLFLDDNAPVPGADLVTRIRELNHRPRLIVLASCESAGKGGVGLAAIGPKLADAGIPAVIAMQGNITMDSAREFMKVFFTALMSDGQIDRAVSLARGAIRDRQDYWKPVLFMRLLNGRIWYSKGFEDSGQDTPWKTILQRIKLASLPPPQPPLKPSPACIPVIGPDILEPLWGTTREISYWLADPERYNFPLEEHLSEDLPVVAQYIKNDRDDDEFDIGLGAWLQHRLRTDFDANVWEYLAAAGRARRASDVEDAHELLAALPLPVYFTACQDLLLEDALLEARRQPRSDFARWSKDLQNEAAFPRVDETLYKPSVAEPYVFHLFGYAAVPESRVVTEDDFTDYMLGINRQESLAFTPSFVNSALTSGALLFLGFHFKDRAFQIVLRNTLSRIANPKKKSMWVGAQIPPEADRYRRVRAARTYIEKTIGAELKIYWGSSQDFIEDFGRNARREFPAWFAPKPPADAPVPGASQ